jgi:hypothetical protein
MKSILGRPLTLERRDGSLQLTLLERRRSPETAQAESMARLREELRLRLLELEQRHATQVLRHLVFLNDVLGRQGWAGVQVMNSALLGKAIGQVQMLIELEPSARLGRLVDKLRLMQAGAAQREERVQARARALAEGAPLEVTEVSSEQYEISQREWEATAPAPLDLAPLGPPGEPPRG